MSIHLSSLPRALALLIACLALHGCGGGADAGSSQDGRAVVEVREVVARLYAALGRADGVGVCRELTLPVRRVAAAANPGGKASSCGDSLDQLLASARSAGTLGVASTLRVMDVTVEGGTAVANAIVGGEYLALPAERTGSGWKIDSLGYSDE